jgi:hypothetical protein
MRRSFSALILASTLASVACGNSGTPSPHADAAADTPVSCADLPAAYRAALVTAQACDPDGGAGQCSIGVRLDLLCGCATYVNDPTLPHDLIAEWQAQSCLSTPLYQMMGCVTGCRVETPRMCVAVDGGTGVCKEPDTP